MLVLSLSCLFSKRSMLLSLVCWVMLCYFCLQFLGGSRHALLHTFLLLSPISADDCRYICDAAIVTLFRRGSCPPITYFPCFVLFITALYFLIDELLRIAGLSSQVHFGPILPGAAQRAGESNPSRNRAFLGSSTMGQSIAAGGRPHASYISMSSVSVQVSGAQHMRQHEHQLVGSSPTPEAATTSWSNTYLPLLFVFRLLAHSHYPLSSIF